MSQTTQATSTVTGGIAERAMLVDLTITSWGGRRRDDRGAESVRREFGTDTRYGKYTKHLVDPDVLKPLRQIQVAASDEHRRRTLPWLDTGGRILSSVGYYEYAAAMRQFHAKWETAVATFVTEYPSHVTRAYQALNGLFNAGEYPDAHRIADRFGFGYNVLPMPSADDFRVNLGDAEAARIKRQIQESLDLALEKAMQDVVERIRETVGHMSSKLKSYTATADGVTGAFRDTLVSNIKDLVDILPSLNITHSPVLDAITTKMREDLLVYQPQALRENEEARVDVAKAADDILSSLVGFIA